MDCRGLSCCRGRLVHEPYGEGFRRASVLMLPIVSLLGCKSCSNSVDLPVLDLAGWLRSADAPRERMHG